MNEEKLKLIYGALLHDVGKIVYRGSSAQGTHSKLGADFIAGIVPEGDPLRNEVVDQIRYHHARELKGAPLTSDSLAYLTYFADNISAGIDRKEEGGDSGFDREAKLRRVFNIVAGHHDDSVVEHEDYNAIRERIKREFAGFALEEGRIGSLINLFEATCDRVPSSTNKAELVDVSLFDHAKTTAALAACLYDYLSAVGVEDYRSILFNGEKASAYYDKQMFLLWSCDLSGIQSFIYQISGSGALKQLRARSFYLEILLEHCMDELLARLDLTRCNLLYTGGGHAYALFPNTEKAKSQIEAFSSELGAWLMERFRTDLFCACAFVPCSANDLMNKEGTSRGSKRYRLLYKDLGDKLSAIKRSRYTAEEIAKLNFASRREWDHTRECKECHRSDAEIREGDGLCPLCGALGTISPKLVRKSVFVVSSEGELELPFGCWLSVFSRDEYRAERPDAIRIYTKEWDTGDALATHIWMGDYTADQHGRGIGDYAESGISLEEGKGIERLGVLRADVDNLGMIFSSGLPDDKISISRTTALSRSLSYFFKQRINGILDEGGYRAQIIYSGGDDLFLIGNWSDVIYAALDIRKALDDFTGNGVLTISAGLGMYDPRYPLARMASEVGELEDAAKGHDGKNALAIWDKGNVFSWDEFEGGVCGKLGEIKSAFECNDKGKSFIYRLLDLLRDLDNPISVPRLAYLLARSFEDDKERGAEISKRFFEWALDEGERRCLVTALEWYVYSIRERG
ncbi:type III-A CRISPR-associated protein Cas10/Csm1 [Gordonibacter sp. An230]|uniref:type III-A CRISPR-associated protein Cas10/Csm1 n=1 Tax=Gordonibacter sp. An230 TaxID=1965592 RepID=UPI000B3779B6|nr:type III-A CRISPR-associated protein Cas10/Csm1 [Gordonibacter sp. An230]OUO91766.1 type III-A CRISPR-associated protein Cas10/Csm1 [Gordonibacter sp. An230]